MSESASVRGALLRLCCPLLLLVGSSIAWAQHETMPPDAAAGADRFVRSCAGCHGMDGNEVEGVDLARGEFRHATTDEDLERIIASGIPGTAMPPSGLSGIRAREIVAYLRFLASQPPLSGDAERGKAIVAGKGGCLNCHRVEGVGSRVGPDLSNVGVVRRGVELRQALLEPDAEVAPENRYVRAVKQDGSAVTGRLLNHDIFTAQLITSSGLVSLDKSTLREFSFVEKSPMPSMQGRLTEEETTDVVRYLASLKGIRP
jgi:putative heme-binding domain-containing protein